MLPRAFRQHQTRTLADVAVSLTLGGWLILAAGLVDGRIVRFAESRDVALGAALVFGLVGGRLLRWRRTLPGIGLRWGWLLLGVLAMAISTAGAAALDRWAPSAAQPWDMVAYWLPLALLAMVAFGAPIARAQHLAAKGLARHEEGERFVGLAAAGAGTLAAAFSLFTVTNHYESTTHVVWSAVPALPGILVGLFAAFFANGREGRRRGFVAKVEAGRVEGYRIDAGEAGKVLIRVTKPAGDGYRAAEHREPVAELDDGGEVVRSMES